MNLVSKKYKFVLVTIPKNACVTMRYWFDFLENERVLEFEHTLQRPEGSSIHKKCKRLYSGRLIWPWYRKFVILRNPWKRVASGYFTKFVQTDYGAHLKIKNISDFIHYLSDIDVNKGSCDEHWRSQKTFVKGLKINSYLKMESLQCDFDSMIDVIGLDRIKLPNWKKSNAREGWYQGVFTAEETQLIGKIYKMDAQLGGYKCPEEMIKN